MGKTNKYPETGQTLEALLNLKADLTYVKFNDIYNEVKKIRLMNNLKENPENLIGRVRRSLTNDTNIKFLNDSEQSNQLSISLRFPKYKVVSKYPVQFKEKGLVKDVKSVEENSFKLIRNDE